jgi:hypothetical protein
MRRLFVDCGDNPAPQGRTARSKNRFTRLACFQYGDDVACKNHLDGSNATRQPACATLLTGLAGETTAFAVPAEAGITFLL